MVSEGASHFSAEERAELLAIKGVGPTVIQRLEEIGITSLPQLAAELAEEICDKVATILNSTCWKNAPRAKASIEAAIAYAKLETASVS